MKEFAMKPFLISVLLFFTLVGCSVKVNHVPRRDFLVDHMRPMLAMEKQLDRIRDTLKLYLSLNALGKKEMRKIKEHLDVYYIYYLNANVQLGRGNAQLFLHYIGLATQELNSMMDLLDEGFLPDYLLPGKEDEKTSL